MRHIQTQPIKLSRPIENRSGIILLISMLMLTVIAMMGLTVAGMVGAEFKVTRMRADHVDVFYLAEAALRHAEKQLMDDYESNNGFGLGEKWSFALDGSAYGQSASSLYCAGCASSTSTDLMSGSWLAGGAQVLSRSYVENGTTYSYQALVWDNDESAREGTACPDSSATVDCDGLIIARAQASASRFGKVLSTSTQELILVGGTAGRRFINTTPQAGSSSSKTSESNSGEVKSISSSRDLS